MTLPRTPATAITSSVDDTFDDFKSERLASDFRHSGRFGVFQRLASEGKIVVGGGNCSCMVVVREVAGAEDKIEEKVNSILKDQTARYTVLSSRFVRISQTCLDASKP